MTKEEEVYSRSTDILFDLQQKILSAASEIQDPAIATLDSLADMTEELESVVSEANAILRSQNSDTCTLFDCIQRRQDKLNC